MNERIKELAALATTVVEPDDPDYRHETFDKAKFAELIIKDQQREWVGLTDEEINSWDLPDKPTVAQFARFVEAKLKEKNT